MVKKYKEWPERRELVIGKIIKVNPFSALVRLKEYDKEGMIHISEIARKWVKDIRVFAKVGQVVVVRVMRIDKEKGHITLSLKKVSKYDTEEKMREYKRELKAEKMLKEVAKEMKIDLDKVYEEVGFKLEEEFGEIFKAFQASLTEEELLIKKGIPEKTVEIIKKVAEKQMEIKEKVIKKDIDIKSLKPNGVEVIKEILEDTKKKYNIEIRYVSAPKYSLLLKTKDAKSGEKKLDEASQYILDKITGE